MADATTTTPADLSAREQEALDARREGKSNQEIADQMGIKSTGAVSSYLKGAADKGHDVPGGTNGGTSTVRRAPGSVPTAADALAEARDRIAAPLTRADEAIARATEAVSTFDADQVRADEEARIKDAIKALRAMANDADHLDTVVTDRRAQVEANVAAANERRDAVAARVTEELAAFDAATA